MAVALQNSEPANALGQTFTETFHRRTGKPLGIVVGDAHIGGLVALASPDRPSLFIDASRERAPWIRESDIAEKGAVVVWPLTDPSGRPPASISARFPDLVAEVPRAFERALQGNLPLM